MKVGEAFVERPFFPRRQLEIAGWLRITNLLPAADATMAADLQRLRNAKVVPAPQLQQGSQT
jgi:hypothetical protein